MNKAKIYPWIFAVVFVLIVAALSEVVSAEETINGKIVKSFNFPGKKGSGVTGLAWDGKYLWVATSCKTTVSYHKVHEFKQILQIDPDTGTLINSITPENYGIYLYGLAWDGKYFWCSDEYSHLNKIDPSSGNVISWFYGPGDLDGLTWDGGYLWGR